MAIDDRIPSMTDKELDNLRANAERLAQSGSPAQKAEAARLLPLIDISSKERKVTNAAAAADKKVARQQSLAEARARKVAMKKAAAAEAAEAKAGAN